MNKTLLVWMAIAGFLTVRSFARPSYAVGLYMLTFFAAPKFWWWGDLLEDYRWNLLAGILLLGTLALSGRHPSTERDSPLKTNAVPILLLMALNVLLVHLLFAANADSSLGWVINRLKFILLFFMLQFAIRDDKDYEIVTISIALAMGYIGYEATINERGSFSGGRLEGIGAAGVQSSNQLASLLITGLPLAATVLFTNATTWVKAVVLLCAGLAFNVVLMCNSRAAFLGVLFAGVLFLAMASGPARKQALRLAGVAALGGFLLLGDPEIIARFQTTFSGEAQRDNSAQSRILFWTSASRMALDYPLGSGGNSFSEGRGWRYMRNFEGDGATRAIHNGFLTELVDWGVQGFVLMLVFLGAVFKTMLRGRRLAIATNDVRGVIVYACLAASLSAWMVSSVFGDYLNDEWGFWTAALTYAYFRLRSEVPVTQESESPTTRPAASPVIANAMPRGSLQ